MRPSNNLEKKIPSDTYWKVQLVRMKVQAYSSSEPPLEYNQEQTPWRIKVGYGLFNQLGSYRNIIQLQISSRRKTDKEIPESSRLEFL